MAVVIESLIICDNCRAVFGRDNTSMKGMEQRKRARTNGWAYSGNLDLCPDCRPKRKDGSIHKHGRRRPKTKTK
jgi:hypothetical protein